MVDYAFLEHCLREELNSNAKRAMAVLKPLKLTITNYPDEQIEYFEVENNPESLEAGMRNVTFSKTLWIEREDFEKNPPKKYNRLFVGNKVRIKSAYIVNCTGFFEDSDGNVTEVFAEYDPETKGGHSADGSKVRGTIHWVDANNSVDAEVRLYDRLFTDPDPDRFDKNFLELINPCSLEILRGCKLERSLENAAFPQSFQFLRLGYFCADMRDSKPGALVFNRSVALKEGFKKD